MEIDSVLFGASQSTALWLSRNQVPSRTYVIVDNDPAKWGLTFEGLPVMGVGTLINVSYGEVIVAFPHAEAAVRQLLVLGVPREKILVPKKSDFTQAFFVTDDQQSSALSFLCDVMEAFERQNIGLILEFGTALGLYRDGSFIPGDCDIDASVRQGQVDSGYVVEALIHAIARGPTVSTATVSWDMSPIAGKVVQFDVTSVEGIPLSVVGRRVVDGISMSSSPTYSVPEEVLHPSSALNFRGVALPIPRDTPSYLEYIYGPEWPTPNPDWTFLDYQFVDPRYRQKNSIE